MVRSVCKPGHESTNIMAPLALDAYQIGWICALLIKVALPKQMLDEHFGILDEQDSINTSLYT